MSAVELLATVRLGDGLEFNELSARTISRLKNKR
jgi:hypothetical protein